MVRDEPHAALASFIAQEEESPTWVTCKINKIMNNVTLKTAYNSIKHKADRGKGAFRI